MKWLLFTVVALALACGGVLLLAFTKPATIAVSRSIDIYAPAAAVFELIDDFHHWPQWAPQDREDGTMVRKYEGEQSGVGAVSTWTSRGRAGAGRMIIVRADPNKDIVVQVDFDAPFVAHNINIFHIEALSDKAVRLTWSMRGTNVFMMKLMSVFVSPERLVGPHFEKGLAALKLAAEGLQP